MYYNFTAIEKGFTIPPSNSNSETNSNSMVPLLSESNDDGVGFTILLYGSGSTIAISLVHSLNRWFNKKNEKYN